MYNRYIRNDNGSYTRIPEEGTPGGPPPGGPPSGGPPPGGPPPGGPSPEGPNPGYSSSRGPSPGGPNPGYSSSGGPSPGGASPGGPNLGGSGGPFQGGPKGPGRPPPGGRPSDSLTGMLRRALDLLHLDHVDTGDLLLLGLLFFLSKEEKADEELLIALGLLLIL